ncbi:Lipoprotein amino terminal region [Popillia japonica]|uniref:Lipoprotein amino terminal region n=1 Tax=Popillia japonica TaxID=7064 RepID=A0AAW1L7B8_POPJA
MWSKILVCLLVGLAAASQPAWKPNTEYVYEISGRTLSGFDDKSNDRNIGIFLQGELSVRPQSDGHLSAKLRSLEYAELQDELDDGWDTEIDDSDLKYQKMPYTQQPFQLLMKNGAIYDIVVSQQVPTWEANLLKSFASQLQLDVNGENLMDSRYNQLPEGDDIDALFKTMEETVTGRVETMYELNPLPEHILQSQPELVPMDQLVKDDDDIIN